MTSQLAQINTVSGISQLNTTLTSLATQLSAGQSAQAALLIGSTVLAPGSAVTVVEAARPSSFGVQLANARERPAGRREELVGPRSSTRSTSARSRPAWFRSRWTPTDTTGATLPDGTLHDHARSRHDQRRSRPRPPTLARLAGAKRRQQTRRHAGPHAVERHDGRPDQRRRRSSDSDLIQLTTFQKRRPSWVTNKALSGLSGASSDLDVIGNNIANANTVGFKNGQRSSPTCTPIRWPPP